MPQGRKHILPPPELELPRTLHDDRHRLEEVEVPVVTISATFKAEIAKFRGERASFEDEAVFSRAHYSMGVALLAQATKDRLTNWYMDPVNYVSQDDWRKIEFVERVGKVTARVLILKKIKDFVDTFARGRLPIAKAIEKPLLYATERARNYIISLHYEAGNILARNGRKVLQVITDPHVRIQYLLEADRSNITFAVFDEETKDEVLKLSAKLKKDVNPGRVVVTGPPVDPRIIDARKRKTPFSFKKRSLRLAVTTGGLGTNMPEIKQILEDLLPNCEKKKLELVLYAGTHKDFKEMFYSQAEESNLSIGDIDSNARVRVVYDQSIIRANQQLMNYVFPWADGFITKPSGDMAYDAVGAGCFILSLDSWGEWEENIEKIFYKMGILEKADVANFSGQIDKLYKERWFESSIRKALEVDELFLAGAKKIVDLQQKLSYNE